MTIIEGQFDRKKLCCAKQCLRFPEKRIKTDVKKLVI